MKSYIFEWADGSKSAMPFDKEMALTALKNWYTKHRCWMYITVKNIRNDKEEIFFESWDIKPNEFHNGTITI